MIEIDLSKDDRYKSLFGFEHIELVHHNLSLQIMIQRLQMHLMLTKIKSKQ